MGNNQSSKKSGSPSKAEATTSLKAEKTTPPKTVQEAKTTPPKEAKTTPTKEAKTTPPKEAKTTPPKEAKTTHPKEAKTTSKEANNTPPKEEVKTIPPKEEVKTTPPKKEVKTTPPKAEVKTTPPKVSKEPATPTTPMSELPDLVLLHIASFLSFQDIITLSKTCLRLHFVLPKFYKTIFKGKDFKLYGEYSPHWNPQLFFDGPKLKNRVKSLKMSMSWVDQGWGHRKGEVWVQLVRGEEVVEECKDTFGVAEHEEKKVEVDVSKEEVVRLAREGDVFRFMRNIGGGGGHQLTVKDFTVHMVNTRKNSDSLCYFDTQLNCSNHGVTP